MDLTITKVDEVWCRITGDFQAIEQLAEHFTFEVPGSKFSPKHVNNGGNWDGYIRLLNRMTGMLYLGLAPKAIVMAYEIGYKIAIDPNLKPSEKDYATAVEQFIKDLNLPFDPHDYQVDTLNQVLNRKRMIVISPTSSGKSLIIYFIAKFLNKKVLIISPRVGLVKQLSKDIIDYGYKENIHAIMAGTAKQTDDLITISTWQSLVKLPRKYFEQYDILMGDEVHLFDSKSLVGIMEKTNTIEYKIGLTGSLKGTKTHELVLTGLFGPVYETISTREMIDRGISSDVKIIVIVFIHNEQTQKQLPANHSYQEENDMIIQNVKRNKYIAKLVESMKGNTIVMFRKIEKHGASLKQIIEETGKTVHYIHGGIKADAREEIRQMFENVQDEVLLASSGTMSTGISINNIQNMIQGNAIKSQIDVVQTLGRGLRKDGKANMLTFVDLADKFTRIKGKTEEYGYSYKHLLERLKIYNEKELPYKIIEINL